MEAERPSDDWTKDFVNRVTNDAQRCERDLCIELVMMHRKLQDHLTAREMLDLILKALRR